MVTMKGCDNVVIIELECVILKSSWTRSILGNVNYIELKSSLMRS